MPNFAGAMVAQIMVKLFQRFRYVGIAAPVNDVEPLASVSVIEAEPVFGCGLRSRFRGSPNRRDQQKSEQKQTRMTDHHG